MQVETDNPLIESILGPERDRIGRQYEAYRGHVYRMYNYCLALRPCAPEERDKLAIAACFHDIGIWPARTLDYIAPSMEHARAYLTEQRQDSWIDEICRMIELHHKPSACIDERSPLVEVFRKGDLVDVSLGLVTHGIPREQVRRIRKALPNAGFHRFLLATGLRWIPRHPLHPFPFVRR